MTRLVVCGCPADALSAARDVEGAFAVLMDGSPTFSLAFMTPFGACVREYPRGDGDAFLLSVARQHVASGTPMACLWSSPPSLAHDVAAALADSFEPLETGHSAGAVDVAAALADFRAVRRQDCSRAWSISPLHHRAFVAGDGLRASLHRDGARWIVRWSAPDGRDGGIHLVVGRTPTASEVEGVDGRTGRVVTATHSTMPDGSGGSRVVQVLLLEVEPGFSGAFPDGHRPRHGILLPEAA